MEGEQWRLVGGYEGLYEVSNFGRVRSLPRNTTSGRILSPGDHRGYKRVSLNKDGVRKGYSVHRLVAFAFLPVPTPDRDEVNHIDGNPSNNVVTNLEWCTHSENLRHSFDNLGRVGPNKGIKYTHCNKGHAYEPNNVRYTNLGHPQCLICNHAWGKAGRERAKARKANEIPVTIAWETCEACKGSGHQDGMDGIMTCGYCQGNCTQRIRDSKGRWSNRPNVNAIRAEFADTPIKRED